MKKLTLTHIGLDSWDRPVYVCEGRLYVDVDPRKDCNPQIHTKNGNAFDGEPLSPVKKDLEIEFVPQRDTWHF